MTGMYRWRPTDELLAHSNVARFMARHGINDHAELLRKSTDEIAWFWDAVVHDLPIDFFEPYHRVYDDCGGMAWAHWFVGGKLNLAWNCLDRHARSQRKTKPAILWESEAGATRSLTYEELAAGTNQLANGLLRRGVREGDRIGLFMPMIPEVVQAFLACAKIGAIAVPIFSGYGAQAVAARLNDCETKVLFTVDAFQRRGAPIEALQIAREAASLSPSVEHIIAFEFLGGRELRRPGHELWWHEVVSGESAERESMPVDSETPFMIAYTSGTTGKPKGSVHVHGGFLVKIAQEVCHQLDLREEDRLYWVTDMGWIMGPWEIVGALALGGTVFLYEGAPDFPRPDRLWSMVERHGITILGVSPTLIRALMRYGDAPLKDHDLSHLRILGSTGEPWNPDPWLWYFEKVGRGRCPIINISGGTEVGACLLSAFPTRPLKPCSLGGPSLGMAMDVFDAEGRSLRGGVGELVCTKPWPGMTRGLWRDPERYLATYWSRWPNVWQHGDWASVDADGDWFLHGRSDDTIKIAGKRLGPAEVESALINHQAVAESAAIGVPDELKGEVVWCFVVLQRGQEPTDVLRDQLKQQVAGSLGKSFTPQRIVFVSDLPRTRSAKILRRAIRACALGHDPGDLSSLENPAALDAIARACS